MRPITLLPLAAFALGTLVASPLHGQLERPPTTRPTAIVPPATLTATASYDKILLTFPGVSGATGYRVTRTNNAGEPETVVFEGDLDKFAFEGAACTPIQGCAWADLNVRQRVLYSYRMYSLFANTSGPPLVSPPGPVASATLKGGFKPR